MTDLSKTIIAKSDQLNADDLIGRTLTIKVTKVSIAASPEQPIAINYEGDNKKPYMPCKSMRRVLVQCWGSDGNAYIGRSMTLYRDPNVKFGGLEVGGIRISHMSNIKSAVTMALTASKANKKPYTVKPLAVSNAPSAPVIDDIPDDLTDPAPQDEIDDLSLLLINAQSSDDIKAAGAAIAAAKLNDVQKKSMNDLYKTHVARVRALASGE